MIVDWHCLLARVTIVGTEKEGNKSARVFAIISRRASERSLREEATEKSTAFLVSLNFVIRLISAIRVGEIRDALDGVGPPGHACPQFIHIKYFNDGARPGAYLVDDLFFDSLHVLRLYFIPSVNNRFEFVSEPPQLFPQRPKTRFTIRLIRAAAAFSCHTLDHRCPPEKNAKLNEP